MEGEEILQLMDSHWFFHHGYLFSSMRKPPNTPKPLHEEPNIETFSDISPSLQLRSMSDQCLSSKTSLSSLFDHSVSPSSVLRSPRKLQTILSGKEVASEQAEEIKEKILKEKVVKFGRRRKKLRSKSLTELEFDELKGFMDLGFVFSEEDKESSLLVSIIPGLKRLFPKDGDCNNNNMKEKEDIHESSSSGSEKEKGKGKERRPYLSEAWDFGKEKNGEEKKLMELRIPKVRNDWGDEVSIKDQLMSWAHTVASTVR